MSATARLVQKKLLSGEKTHDEMLVWWKQNEEAFDEDDRAAVRGVLGLSKDPLDVPFREVVPDCWFSDLLDLQHESESPTSFYFLAAVSVFCNLVGRKVMIDRGNHRVGLDLSTLLISPAGRGRRSTACDFVVYKIGEPAGLQIVADKFTYEHFGDSLVETCEVKPTRDSRRAFRPRALVYAGEMSVLLGKGGYGDSIIAPLTDILGKTSRFNWGTVKRGKVEFVEPCVQAVLTTSPDWMVSNIPAEALGGGMLSRFLLSVRDQPEKVVTWANEIDPELIHKVVEALKRCTSGAGEFTRPGKKAFEWYHEWYQGHAERYLHGEIPDQRMAPYFARKHDHLLRLAAVLTMAKGDKLSYTVARFEEALRILDWLERDMPKAYASIAVSPLAAAQGEICRALRTAENGLMTHSKLQKKMYRMLPLSDQFKAVMQSLTDIGVVRKIPNLGSKGCKYMLVKDLEG